jgi:starch synthase
MRKIKVLNQTIVTSVNLVIEGNKLGPIIFVTPELGRWSTVGGLGVMVDELTQGLALLGQEVICITPYYEKNRKGESGYLSKDPAGFKYIGNVDVLLDQKYTLGIHYGEVNKVKIYFLHNYDIFPTPYAEGPNIFILKQICLMSKGALECLCFIKVIPALIITNDWFTGLTAAYSKFGHFGETFKGTTFFHIVHNLEPTYEGRIYPTIQSDTMDYIHRLPTNCLIDPFWKHKVINPSRCAIYMSDQWGTVSPSYKKDLMDPNNKNSPLAPLLNNHQRPFAFPNGISRKQRLKALTEKAGTSREEAKKQIQLKYFGFQDADYSIPLYSFVGRITQQKGVLLILEAVETLIQRTGGKINILIGGMGNLKDPYLINCMHKINYLRLKYPWNFWCNPNEFFTDGPLINLGSDFGLMPSVFEPGGIVQHEFFIASTPVIAFKTGGLKDTVIEFDWNSGKGNGILFENHHFYDFVSAVERSLFLFKNKEKYEKCRSNAFNSAIDISDVSQAWCKEFYRLRNKVNTLHN